MKRSATILISAGAGLVLLAGGTTAGAAIAAGPVDGSGVIHGCWTNTAINGSHVFVLQDAGTTCPKGTTAISWNQQGPAGPAGPVGPAGAIGPQGPAGAPGPQGPKGDTGAQGPAGPAGATGPAGPAGADGSTVLNGTGAPADSVGNNGDFYIDTAADVLYGPKANGTWPAAGASLAGPAGPKGDTGPAGPQGPPGPPGPSLSAITDLNGLACAAFGGRAGTIAVGATASDGTLGLKCNPSPTCTHSNGVGQNYTDCSAALGVPGDAATYNLSMADAAAFAYIAANGGTGSNFNFVTCSGGNQGSAVQVLLNGTSVIWETAGQFAGHVEVSTSTQQTCPGFISGTWT